MVILLLLRIARSKKEPFLISHHNTRNKMREEQQSLTQGCIISTSPYLSSYNQKRPCWLPLSSTAAVGQHCHEHGPLVFPVRSGCSRTSPHQILETFLIFHQGKQHSFSGRMIIALGSSYLTPCLFISNFSVPFTLSKHIYPSFHWYKYAMILWCCLFHPCVNRIWWCLGQKEWDKL